MADRALVRQVLDRDAFRTVFQPIYSLSSGAVRGVEALTRFTVGSQSSPAWWFTEAHAVNLGVELELAALRRALATAVSLPAGMSLSVNLSPAALLDLRVVLSLTERHVADLVVEITEQAPLHGHPEVLERRERLREMGIRVAVDDVTANRASMRNLLRLRPDEVKTDLWLTARLESDARRRLLAGGLVRLAHRMGAHVVAEGVETPGQLAAWRRLGADGAQGFLLAVPAPLEEAVEAGTIAVA